MCTIILFNMKPVVEFLWGSPIITPESDEDWYIWTDELPNHYIHIAPTLAGSRSRKTDCSVREINSMTKTFYQNPFYNVFCLFSKEYYIDEVAFNQLKEIINLKEDIARINLPAFYRDLSNWLSFNEKYPIETYTPKKLSKLIKNYTLADSLTSGLSLEEALNIGDKISAPIKLEKISIEEGFDILKECQNKYENSQIKKFFTKEPNKNLYNQLELITNSIELNKLTGLSVQGPV